jgi:hypothetical protein
MSNDQTIKRIDGKLSALLQEVKKPPVETWVKVSIIQSLTGWDKEGMRTARMNGLVKMKREKGEIFYLLESLNEIFIKKAI